MVSRILLLAVGHQQRAHLKKRTLNKMRVASSKKSCYNLEEDNHVDRFVKKKADALTGIDYGVSAKAPLRLLEIQITHSRNVEVFCLLEKK